jgi:hypothetical protein
MRKSVRSLENIEIVPLIAQQATLSYYRDLVIRDW